MKETTGEGSMTIVTIAIIAAIAAAAIAFAPRIVETIQQKWTAGTEVVMPIVNR